MNTSTLDIMRKLEDEGGVVFIKDDASSEWKAVIDGSVIAANKYLSDCVQRAAKELGE